eukprot:14902734-Alexandrium_andersonii.AAC.1
MPSAARAGGPPACRVSTICSYAAGICTHGPHVQEYFRMWMRDTTRSRESVHGNSQLGASINRCMSVGSVQGEVRSKEVRGRVPSLRRRLAKHVVWREDARATGGPSQMRASPSRASAS